MTTKKFSQILSLSVCIFAIAGTASAETTIGRWCDIPIQGKSDYNSIKELVVADNGDVELRSQHGDGSKRTEKLVEKDASHYLTLNKHGEKYRIVPGSGDLELSDADGPFRVATKLGNTPRSGECGF